jgi:hypothetical protein
MIAGQKAETVWQNVFRSVSKAIVGLARNNASLQEISHVPIKSYLAEANNYANFPQGFNLCGEVSRAITNLLGSRFVAGRGAADDGSDPGVAKFQAVVAGGACWLAGEAQFVQHGIHEVAGAIAGEGAARSIGSMRTGSKPEDENAGARVSEARDWPGPVGLILIGAALCLADASAVIAEPRATLAADDRFSNLKEKRGRILFSRACHCISMIAVVWQ